MAPLDLSKQMGEFAESPSVPAQVADAKLRTLRSVVERLCEGEHAVEVGLGPERTLTVFKEAIDREYVHVKFTQTKGGTEVGFRLDRSASDFSKADFEKGIGTAHLEGDLTLDYVKVRCLAEIDLSMLAGTGRLMKLESNQRPRIP